MDRPRYAGRGRVTGLSGGATKDSEPALVGAAVSDEDGRRLTLAERKAAAARAAADAEAPTATTDADAGDDEETR